LPILHRHCNRPGFKGSGSGVRKIHPMKSLLCIAVVTLFAWSAAKGVVDSNWTREFHPKKQIGSIHVVDTIGISTESNLVILWDARDGRVLDTISFGTRQINGAWIVSQGKEVVVYLHDMTDSTWGSVLWLNLKTHAKVDSIGPLYRYNEQADVSGIGSEYGSVSDNNASLFISFTIHTIANSHIDVYSPYGQKFDLLNRKKDGYTFPISSQFPHRFEAGDSVITFVPPLDEYVRGLKSISPSGRYMFDGSQLFDVQRNSFIRQATKNEWYVARYGPTDASAIALMRTDRYDINFPFFRLCLINIFRDSVLQVLDTNIRIWSTFWCDPTSRTTYIAKYGSVAKRIADVSSLAGRTDCLNSIPDTVVSDSLYLAGIVVVPSFSSSTPVLDRGDGSPAVTTLYASWPSPGTYTVRFGTIHNSDTVWACSQPVVVRKRGLDASKGPRFHLEESPICSIDLRKEDTILVSNQLGWVVALDSSLKVQGCAKSPLMSFGAYWTTQNNVQCLQYDKAYNHPPSDYEYLYYRARSSQVQLERSSLTLQDTLMFRDAISSTTWSVATSAQMLGQTSSGSMWAIVSLYSEGSGHSLNPPHLNGGLYKLNNGTFEPRGDIRKGTYPYLIYNGQHHKGVVTPNERYVVTSFYNYLPSSWDLKKYFAVFDVAGDSLVTFIPGYSVSDFRCVGSRFVVTDSAWLQFEPFRVSDKHRFIGPFAEDAVPDHAIAWKDGWFYSFHPNGRVHDSVQADTMRPTVIRVFKDGRIIAGYASGLVAIYGERKRDLTNVEPSSGESTEILQCWPNPTSSTLHCRLDTSFSLPATLEIFDMQGRLCGATTLDSRDADVNLPTVMNMEPTGVFMMRVYSGSSVLHTKIVVVR
jgi:hypothetical protein